MKKILFIATLLLSMVSCQTNEIKFEVNLDDALKLINQKISYIKNPMTTIAVAEFKDARPNTDFPYTIEKGKATAFIHNYMIESLTKRGMTLSKENEAEFIIRGELIKMWPVELDRDGGRTTVACDVTMKLELFNTKENKVVWTSDMDFSYQLTEDFLHSDSMPAKLVGNCLNVMVERLINMEKFREILKLQAVDEL